jgi:YfiH family protein
VNISAAPVPGFITTAALNELAGVRHAFFTREGGYSQGGYGSLNCGLMSGDDRAKVEANRALAMTQLDLAADRLMAVRQVHSAKAVPVDEDFQSIEADALVTRRRGIALGVLGADCAPVLFADEKSGVIAAAHAGWKGALTGILDSTVETMLELGAKTDRMVAVIGPCIAQASYQVGADFPAPFLAEHPDNAAFFAPDGERFRFDLPGYIASRLLRLHIGNVSRLPCDTFRQADRFFSHRRSTLSGDSECGRQLSAIMLEP